MSSLVSWFNLVLSWLACLFGVRTKKAREIGRAGQTVVIVGGGFAGLTLAHYLEATTQFDVVLYDRKDYFEFTPSMLRCIVEPAHWQKTAVRYADLPMLQSPRIQLRCEEVVQLTDQAVQGKDGEWCKYDKLVLAMGSDYYDHIKPDKDSLTFSTREAQLASMHSALRAAAVVNIFGAGLVGVELAAEIAETFPEKKLTLRSREAHLLPGFPEKAQTYALEWFRARNVTIILENSIPPQRYTPASNEVVYNCTGLKAVRLEGLFRKEEPGPQSGASSAPAKDASAPSAHGTPLSFSSFIDARTQSIRIDSQFHLVGTQQQSNSSSRPIFAMGDIMIEDAQKDAPPSARAPKVAYQAELQAWFVSENIKRQEERRGEWRFPRDIIGGGVDTLPTVVDCSLGRKDGLIIFNQLVVTGRLTAMQKDMLEVTKMMFLRGSIVGEFIWTIVDPMTLYVHRLYLAVTGRRSDDEKKAN